MIEITPANIDQVIRSRGGQLICIENDVCGIAQQLLEIDDRLRVKYIPEGQYFMVVLAGAARHGRDHLVLTAEHLDGRVIQRCREVCRPDYSPGADMAVREAQIDADNDYQFRQEVGELSERLAHAIKSDLKKGRPGPIYIPPDVY